MSSAAGTPVSDTCVQKFKELKSKRAYKFVTFKIDGEVVPDVEGAPNASLDDFTAALSESECRYAVLDYEYDKEGFKRSKIVFVNWAPDTAPIRKKMVYAASKDAFKTKLDGIQVEIQATDFDEVDDSVFREKMGQF